MSSNDANARPWALILGSSSGFGAATGIELARNGYNIFGVHFDQRANLPNVEKVQQTIRDAGGEAVFFNENAGSPETMAMVITAIRERLAQGGGPLRILFHSIAFGSLRPYFAETKAAQISEKSMNMTMHLMCNTLVYWTQALVEADLLGQGGRIYAMTSSGSHRVWHTYGAVSAAKAAMESHIRQIALELAPKGITANAIQAGVTDTAALRHIPGHEEMIQYALRVNPHNRLTTVEDVARAVVVLADERTGWMTGNTLRVDGGEDIVG